MRERLRVGEVAGPVGVTPKTPRHHEKVGLLEGPERSDSGYRLYPADDLLRLRRTKRPRSLGLSLDRVRSGDLLSRVGTDTTLLKAALAGSLTNTVVGAVVFGGKV